MQWNGCIVRCVPVCWALHSSPHSQVPGPPDTDPTRRLVNLHGSLPCPGCIIPAVQVGQLRPTEAACLPRGHMAERCPGQDANPGRPAGGPKRNRSIWSLRRCPRSRPLLCAAVMNAATRGVVRWAMGCRAGCNVPFPVSRCGHPSRLRAVMPSFHLLTGEATVTKSLIQPQPGCCCDGILYTWLTPTISRLEVKSV